MDSATRSILIVDDDVDTCSNLSDILTDLGYQVDQAHDGLQALELVRRKSYDVALLDFKMPGMDGLTLYRAIKQERAATVAIVITAYMNPDTESAARNAGAWQILSKPVELLRLVPLVDEAVRQPLVMIVDDDPDLCSSLWDLLRERNYRVCVAHSVREAEVRLSTGHYQAVLVDLQFPVGDGSSVFHAVQQSNPLARTILITGYRSEMQSLVDQTLAEGADAVCYKPFNIDELLQTLARLVPQEGSAPAENR